MAKRGKRGIPKVPSIQPSQRKGSKAGRAYDTFTLRQNRVKTPIGETYTGNGDGKGGDGPNRLRGSAESIARANARKTSWPRTQRAMQDFLDSGQEDSDKLLPFRPTNTIGPSSRPPRRPRTQAAGYDGRSKTVRILFSYKESATSLDGAIYEYYDVPYNVWRMVKRNVSTGRTINRILNNYQYGVLREAPKD